MVIEWELFAPNPKTPYYYKARYRPEHWREVTPEYLDLLRYKQRYTQTDTVRILAFLDRLLLEVKGEESEFGKSRIPYGVKKFDGRLKTKKQKRRY